MSAVILRRSLRAVAHMVRPMATTTGSSAMASKAGRLEDPRAIAYVGNLHRSNAQELIARVPVIEVDGHVAMCDGGGGATGHPLEYIQLDKRAGAGPATCKYCGLRFKSSGHGHGH